VRKRGHLVLLTSFVFGTIMLVSILQAGQNLDSPIPGSNNQFVFAQQPSDRPLPHLSDDNLRAELVADTGLRFPTGLTFLDSRGTMIVLEKESGNAYLVENGKITSTVFHSPVGLAQEQGLLSVTSVNEAELTNVPGQQADVNKVYVFMYLTEADSEGRASGNKIYRFTWDPEVKVLRDKTLILTLPSDPGPSHNGGKLIVDRRGYLFTVIGDVNRVGSILQNIVEASTPDDTSVIIRLNLDGSFVRDNPFTSYGRETLNRYYAYGVRNSFGLSIDPLTGNLWDTENGENDNDEINIVHPGFNSGWSKIMGPIGETQRSTNDLFDLQGSYYSDPLFVWRIPIGVTDIEFFNSDVLGEKYAYNIFIGDFNGGSLYFFRPNNDRNGLALNEHSELQDKIADSHDEANLSRLGGFDAGISDLETGPDGYLYVLAMDGRIYRVVPKPSCDVLLADPNNVNPSADAGADRTEAPGNRVELDATDSWDPNPNGRIVQYSWIHKSGPMVEIERSDTDFASFIVPDVEETQQLTIELVITDDNCAQDSDEIVITINPSQ
jgi:aldose sugar dehydrogenase